MCPAAHMSARSGPPSLPARVLGLTSPILLWIVFAFQGCCVLEWGKETPGSLHTLMGGVRRGGGHQGGEEICSGAAAWL